MSKRKETEMQKKKRQLRYKFRAIVRFVILNKDYLEAIDNQKITTNVYKNIAMMVRQERQLGIITNAEKALIRTPAWVRTVEDRKKMVNLTLNVACFQRYPPKIRARLAPHIKYVSCNAGRKLIKAGHDLMAVYFILSGEVDIIAHNYNPDTGLTESKCIAVVGPGECIGELEFLVGHKKRIYDVTSKDNLELLLIYDDVFNEILRPFLQKRWDQKKVALAQFDYFKEWTPVQIMFACKIGTLKQYEPLETVYYEDKGPLTPVHFVISGQCMILQCLKMKVYEVDGKKKYKLVDIQDPEHSTMFTNAAEQLKTHAESMFDANEDNSSDSEEEENPEEEVAGVYRKARKSDFKKYALMCGVDLTQGIHRESAHLYHEAVKRASTVETDALRKSSVSRRSIDPEEIRRSTLRRSSSVSRKSEVRFAETPYKIETHFVDVGSLSYGGVFGLGEELDHRVVMARTTVQCFTLPRFWVLEKSQNPGNIWQRRRFYIDVTIPTRELLFKNFLATRKWKVYKKKLINETLDKTKVGNPTKKQDIPVLCRIVEADENEDDN